MLVLVLSILDIGANCQSKRGNEWISGAGGQKVTFDNTNITTSNSVFFSTYFTQGNSNICDTDGKLILCSNGFTIYDSNANIINGGDTLVPKAFFNHSGGWSLYSQSSIFLPVDSDKYYFITPCNSEGNLCFGCHYDELFYHAIDMKANGGLGMVVKRMQEAKKGVSFSRSQMMACRHGNGKDWWLLKQGGDSNIVYKFLVTQDSIYDKGRQVFDAPYWGANDLQGQSTFSKDGNRYASACQSDGLLGEIFIADFDRCWGVLSYPKVIQMPIASQYEPLDSTITERSPTGLCYSPNGKLLYVFGYSNIFQYDLQDSSWYHVAGMDTSFIQFQDYTNAYLGPNDKIYIGNFGGASKQMSVIDNPDVKSAGCNFCPKCLRVDTLINGYSLGTPPCMPNYSLGARECYPESTNEIIDKQNALVVYPNPAATRIFIKTKSKQKKELYNSIGQLIFSTKENEIDVSRLSKGVYYIKCEGQSKKVIIE